MKRSFTFLSLVSSWQLFVTSAVFGQAWTPPKHTGAVSITYKNLFNHDHLDTNGKRYPAGRNRQNILSMDIDYGLTRRLAVNVGIPLAYGKHDGEADTHFGATREFIDDGKYHG